VRTPYFSHAQAEGPISSRGACQSAPTPGLATDIGTSELDIDIDELTVCTLVDLFASDGQVVPIRVDGYGRLAASNRSEESFGEPFKWFSELVGAGRRCCNYLGSIEFKDAMETSVLSRVDPACHRPRSKYKRPLPIAMIPSPAVR
jgi:hypothetical protein